MAQCTAYEWLKTIEIFINYQSNKIFIGNQSISVLKGKTLWSMKDMSERWKWSRKKVHSFLEMLKKEHQIDYKSTTKYTIITVENWDFYQSEIQEGTPIIENKDIKGTSKEHQKNTNKKDKEDKELNIYTQIINYLNEKAGTNYRATTKKTKDLINVRENEGFTLDDFKKVIDIKTIEWKNSDFEKFLRPETLFGSKFEGYLNQKVIPAADQDGQVPDSWAGMKKFN